MGTTVKRMISCLLALALMVGLCAVGIPQRVEAATSNTLTTSNVALGKSVAFSSGAQLATDSNFDGNAVKAGLSVLTDGVADSPNWWVNNGNPYVALKSSVLSGPYVFSVDLAASYVTEQISIYSYSRPDWSVYPLEEVTFTISEDGSTWSTLGTVTLSQAIKTTVLDPNYTGDEAVVEIYEFALPVKATGRYVRANFDTNASGLVGIGEIEVYGQKAPSLITSGATITYFGHGTEVGSDANWGSAAVNAGLSVLTDGVGNSPNWWVNNGNPNIGLKSGVLPGDYVFNLDIGAPSSVSRISTYFYSRTDWGVDAPDAVTYSISNDGIKWTQMGTLDKSSATTTALVDERNPDSQAPTIYTFTLLFDAVDARYVKVTFGSNALGMIGLQEIQAYGVKKTITNLALGKMANSNNYTYQITGGGTGYESTGTTKSDGSRYTVTEVELASAARLTDGTIINASAVTYPSNWASQAWNSSGTIMSKYLQIYRNDSRIITLDLGSMRNVTGIRMHFGAQESMGFYMPTNVTYYLSENGTDFYEVADVWNYQSTADSNDSNISGTEMRHEWYSASGISYNARFVKIIFPVNVYILSDELQVWGCEELATSAPALDGCPKYDPLEDYVGHFANAAQTGGVRNEFMAYCGWYINSDGSEVYKTHKTVKEYMTSIAYIDENGVPQDWLFDDHTVMGHYYTSSGTFNSYKAGYTSGKYYADQDDWYEWLCYAFGKDANGNDLTIDGESVINLEALEEAARIAKETLNDPDYKVGVKLVLYPAVEYQENWGYIDGEHIDFTISGCGSQEKALENRAKAYQWYVDQAVAMWENAGFQHLELTGFYYYEETIHESTDRIAKAATQALTQIVHTHVTPTTNTKPAFDSRVGGRLYIYQLPFYQSEGYWNWAEYGFDYALMQPNYSFYDMYTLTQLKECADLCTYYGLGMQMEFGGTASTTYHEKFEDYLNYGKEYGYQSAVVSWYMSTWGCYSMAYNNNGTRYLYDMVYEFVQGQTIPTCQHPEHTTEGRCTNCAAEVVHSYVDGICACGRNQYVSSGQCGDNATYTLDEAGVLTISGTGAMWDFGIYGDASPWTGHRVTKVVIGSGVTAIGANSFYRHVDLVEVSLPDTLEKIGDYGFYSCEKLAQITLPEGLKILGEHVFEYCMALTSIEIPSGITVLPWATFSSCYALKDVTLPDTMTEIQGWAFSHCQALTEIQIPATVMVFGEQVFRGCYSLTTVNIPEGVEIIPNNAFNGCERLPAITIPSTVTLIDEHAFHNTGLQIVEIPGSVKEIKGDAFSYCDALTSVTMSAGLETIGGYVFFHCAELESVTIPETVKTIGAYCFNGCHALTEIQIPDSVTSLGFSALRDCSKLETVTLSKNLTVIEDYTFSGDGALNDVVIPEGIISIGAYAFSGCGSLTDITFSSTVTTLGACVFSDCDALTELTIPDTVTSMGTDLFYDCKELTKVTLSAGLTAIPDRTFCGCGALTEVVIPDSITAIGAHAFDGCTALTSFAVPAQITAIGDYAFIDSGLTEITFRGAAPNFAENALYQITATAYYPRDAAGWTEDVLQGYGGTITWEAYGVTQPTLTLKYPSLSFEAEILYNVYYIAENTDDVVEMGLLTFDSEVADGSIDNATDVIPGFETDGSIWKVGTNGISAKNLGDDLYFMVYAELSDGSYVYSAMKSYSAVNYASTILKRSTSSDYMKALVVSMLNYGTEAQLYFGHNTDSLMNASLTAEQQALVGAYDESMMDSVVAVDSTKAQNFIYDGSSFARRAPSVSFDGAFSINYYFTAANAPDDGMTLYYWNIDDYLAADVLTVDNATGSMEMVATDAENQYWGNVAGIAAKELDQTVFVVGVYEYNGTTYTTGVLNYSIGKYCAGLSANSASAQQSFAQATAVYGYCAKEYFANL